MAFVPARASWASLHGGDSENLIQRVASVGQAVGDVIQEAADELEARSKDEHDRVARATEQLVLDGCSRPELLNTASDREATFSLVWKGAVTGRRVVFPADALAPLLPSRLAWAGFYYLPDARVEDRTICFSCGKALHSWKANDDPFYEHCKASPDCPHVLALADDNLTEEGPASSPRTADDVIVTQNPDVPASDVKIDWRTITDPMPRDGVVDHLIIIVHGIGTNDQTLPLYLEQVRAGMAPAVQRKYVDIPLAVAVDAISWHGLARAPQEIMGNITLPTVPSVREVINDTMLDVLYYRSPVYGQQIIDNVARLLNEKVSLYKREFPYFSGQVSLYCHSLGSVIMFDLLQNQLPSSSSSSSSLPAEHRGTAPTPNAKRRSSTVEHPEGEVAGEGDTWQWPQLCFQVDNMFALGSPVGIMLTTRGDVDESWWPRHATSFAFPGGARFFNVFDPTDPVAFRFEPLINPRYAQLPPALVPTRQRRAAAAPEEGSKAARADFFGWQRIDYALQEGSDSGLMGHIRAISNAHHCYWQSKDLSLFILDTLLTQKLYLQDPAFEAAAREVEERGPRAPRGETRASDWVMEVASVKEQVMWLLTSDLLAAEVHPIVGSRTGTTGGTFTYALGNLRVSSIDVPRHKVIVVCKGDHVTIKATDISASLSAFTWLYKQKGPPHLKDSGTADASVQGLSL